MTTITVPSVGRTPTCSVGVERNFGPLEHAQEFVLVGAEALEELVERRVSGSALEAVEAVFELGGTLGAGDELAIEPASSSGERDALSALD